MKIDDVWLFVHGGQFIRALDGEYLHQERPQKAAVFLPVGSTSGQQWHVAVSGQAVSNQKISLRELMAQVDATLFSLLSRAVQLEHWWLNHQFCGRCATPTVISASELALECSECETLYFPRISPCVIGLVVKGRHCLLAKHVRSKSNRYSCLAGFIEVGESAEEAFRREVKEEVGLEVGALRYITSQNWPFPSQLMLGYMAEYSDGEIAVDGVEIEHADWFTPDAMPELPPERTISRMLINYFINNENESIA